MTPQLENHSTDSRVKSSDTQTLLNASLHQKHMRRSNMFGETILVALDTLLSNLGCTDKKNIVIFRELYVSLYSSVVRALVL